MKIEETVLPSYPSEVQTRIKIDRFTGGVMEGALLETKPLFSRRDDNPLFLLTMSIKDFEDHEAGLMLLILKDLWTSDLPVGGEKAIGRGVLAGKEARIGWDSEEVVIKDPAVLNDEDRDNLQKFVDAFVNCGGANV